MRILFVENHEPFLKTVIPLFLKDHDVIATSSISEAWLHLDAKGFDVVLIDYDLDDGKGDELVKKIRNGSLPIEIVAVSSHEFGNAALLKAGADAVCSKMKFNNIQKVLESLRTT